MNLSINEKSGIPKRVCAIHDLSCIGRCALTVVIPILSAMSAQVIPLPTALLSTHTGGYDGFSFTSLTEEMRKIFEHWESLNFRFDSVYSGFLGDEHQIEFVLDFAEYAKKKSDALFLADPVMGDDGVKYKTYTEKMCALTADITKKADVITPNLTEACILLGIPYRERFERSEIKDMLYELSHSGKTSVVITGVKYDDETVGAAYFDSRNGSCGNHFTPHLNVSYPGTGDAFASVLLGSLLSGRTLGEAVYTSVSYVYKAVSLTSRMGTPIREGILLESLSIDEF